jgi:uncharacterized protein (UPF0332 family)
LKSAQRDLDEAVFSFNRGSFKWATIQAYYSMFHLARALLYVAGYRERSHSALAKAIDLLYVESGRLEGRFLDGLLYGKELRENADYREDFSEEGAGNLVGVAREVLGAASDIVGASSDPAGL